MRLDKYLAESWVGQRKQVRQKIKEGKVSVNQNIIYEAAYEISEEQDEICYEGKLIIHPGKRYFMFHKPTGCITARKDEEHKTVLDYFPKHEQPGLFPVGRLDKDTQGLLLMTNDGALDYFLMNPTHHVKKTYYFWALGCITQEEKEQLERGIKIQGEEDLTKPATLVLDCQGYYDEFASLIDGEDAAVSIKKDGSYRKPVVSGYLTITEGKKHQVKRMLRAVGCYVIALKRISIGKLMLDEQLAPGEYRVLTEEELLLLDFHKDAI